jgi:hypothetical protein
LTGKPSNNSPLKTKQQKFAAADLFHYPRSANLAGVITDIYSWVIVSVPLSTDLDDPSAVPYFLWDEPMTVSEFRRRLASASSPEQTRMLGKLLREARDTDVWKFTTPEEVWRKLPEVSRHLGRRRAFWEFLFDLWQREELVGK